MLGKPAAEIIGIHQTQLHPREEAERYAEIFRTVVKKGIGVSGIPEEILVCRKDGSKVSVEISFSVIDIGGKKIIQGIFRDVTDRKMMEKELRSTKEQLQSIIDNSIAVIYLKDINGKYIFVNSRYENLFHITKKEIIGKTDYDIFPKEMAGKFRKNDLKVLKNREPMKIEEVAPHDDGLHTYVSLKFLLNNEHGEPYGVCGISTDITERKEAEKARNELSRKILNAHEDERKRISRDLHDGMGQTLVAVKLYIHMVEQKVKDGKILDRDAFGKVVLQIDKSIDELRNISMDLRPSFLEEMDIGEALSWYSNRFQNDTGIMINLEVDNFVRVSSKINDHIYRVYQEALNNVYKHSGADIVDVSLERKRNILALGISDNGKGFDVSVRQSKNDRNINGEKGIGLSIIKERAELLGGTCKVVSSHRSGTTIYIEVPV